ncbi:MAG: large-conductance mechanosensitive channel protein MscL [Patescibacteria group bacterium]|jgi:large conductance mechanosensitive channel
MKIIKEFREFAIKGNVMDLAVAVIIGGAFGKIITSFVNDVLMPFIGMLLGGVNFASLKAVLKRASDGTAAATLNYGAFIQAVIDFLLIAAVIFLMVKILNSLKREPAKEKEPEPSTQEKLLTEIRDLLKK